MLHPHLGLHWFCTLKDSDRSIQAKVLFEVVYKEYKQVNDEEEKELQPKKLTYQLKDAKKSFLSHMVCRKDDASGSESESEAIPIASECDRFYVAYKTFDEGDMNDPLGWWKVSKLFSLLIEISLLTSPYRSTREIFQSSPGWLGISWPFLVPVYQLNGCSPSRAIFVQMFDHHSRRIPLWSRC